MCWKSFKKVGFLTTPDGATDMVDETYKVQEGDQIEWDWLIETWEGYRIGQDKYVGVRPIPYQNFNPDHPNYKKLPYVGSLYSNTNSRVQSLVDIMKPLQYMYIILWYRLELAIARDKGKVPVMDITQIPKSMGLDVKHWMHTLSSLGIMFVNPYEEGISDDVVRAGKPSTFNQFQALDLSMSDVILQYIQLLDKVDMMAAELTGITPQRMGSIQNDELVGNVQRSVTQSSYVTEELYIIHNDVKRRVLENLLNISKWCWGNSKKKYVDFIMDDMSRSLIEIDQDFLNSDYDIFVVDSSKEASKIESVRQLMQPALQAGASLNEAVQLLISDNLSDISDKLKQIDLKKEQMMQQQQQQEQQMQQMQMQSQQQMVQQENQFKDMINQRDNETKIQVAQIQAQVSLEVASMAKSEVDDTPIKMEELRVKESLENRKIDTKKEIDERKLDLDTRKNAADINKMMEEIEQKTKDLEMKKKSLKEKDKSDREVSNKKLSLEKQKADKDLSFRREESNKKLELERQKSEKQMELDEELARRDMELKEELKRKELEFKKAQLRQQAKQKAAEPTKKN